MVADDLIMIDGADVFLTSGWWNDKCEMYSN
jgi:hypothetical protein